MYDRRVFLLAEKNSDSSTTKNELVELNLVTGEVKTIIENVKEIVSLTGNKMIYTVSEKTESNSYESTYKTLTNIINVDTLVITELGSKKISIEVLYKLDVETNYVEKLLDLEIQKEESKLSGFAVAMIFMAIAFFFGFIGFAAEAPGLGVVGLIGGFVSLMIGLAVKANKNE